MIKKRFLYFSVSFILFLGMIFTACSNEDEFSDLKLLSKQANIKPTLNEETETFKTTFVSMLKPTTQTRASSDEFFFTEEQIDVITNKSLQMFSSHGFSEEEVIRLVDGDKEKLIFVATLFTALLESPTTYPETRSYALLKTQSESDEDTCYDSASITDCILRATGLKELITGCLTKKAALKLLSKIVPYAGYVVAAADFANCMGWVDW